MAARNDQLSVIFDVLGAPSREDLTYARTEEVRLSLLFVSLLLGARGKVVHGECNATSIRHAPTLPP